MFSCCNDAAATIAFAVRGRAPWRKEDYGVDDSSGGSNNTVIHETDGGLSIAEWAQVPVHCLHRVWRFYGIVFAYHFSHPSIHVIFFIRCPGYMSIADDLYKNIAPHSPLLIIICIEHKQTL